MGSVAKSNLRKGFLIYEEMHFPIYKELQMGSVAKSYMTNGLLIYG